MVNIHLNGDIVTCPNMREIQKRKLERYDHDRKCVYGIKEDFCQAWQNSSEVWRGDWMKEPDREKTFEPPRCIYAGSEKCPMHQIRKETGRKKKQYGITSRHYRQLTSSAHLMVKTAPHKTLFITLTFPPFKRKPNEKELNESFSKFMENLHANYGCKHYVAVRERGSKNGRYHYHVLLSIPFVKWDRLNNAWLAAISDYCERAPNAVTSDPKTLFIKNPGRALRYVCKYFAKTRGQRADTRLVFISQSLMIGPVVDTLGPTNWLTRYKSVYIRQTSDFSTCYRITDAKEYDRFCREFLYPLFEISIDKKGLTYTKTDFYSYFYEKGPPG